MTKPGVWLVVWAGAQLLASTAVPTLETPSAEGDDEMPTQESGGSCALGMGARFEWPSWLVVAGALLGGRRRNRFR